MMENVIGMSVALKIVLALIAFAGARLALLFLDRKLRFDFKNWLGKANDQAVSVYFGLRILAVCILFGLIIS